jgi:hypothetical protein
MFRQLYLSPSWIWIWFVNILYQLKNDITKPASILLCRFALTPTLFNLGIQPVTQFEISCFTSYRSWADPHYRFYGQSSYYDKP